MKYEGLQIPQMKESVESIISMEEIQDSYCDRVDASACPDDDDCNTCLFSDNNINAFIKWYDQQNKVDNGGK